MKHLKTYCLAFITVLTINSCGQPNYEQKVKDFYQAMNASSLEQLQMLYDDSVRVGNFGEFIIYSFEDYQHWLSWDSTFHPTYKILDIEVGEDYADVTVSKECIRIQYLNEEPTISKERLLFKNGKVHHVDYTEIIAFNEAKWVSRRDTMVNWIAVQHPELDGFIFDQTRQGAINYLKAIELFEHKR